MFWSAVFSLLASFPGAPGGSTGSDALVMQARLAAHVQVVASAVVEAESTEAIAALAAGASAIQRSVHTSVAHQASAMSGLTGFAGHQPERAGRLAGVRSQLPPAGFTRAQFASDLAANPASSSDVQPRHPLLMPSAPASRLGPNLWSAAAASSATNQSHDTVHQSHTALLTAANRRISSNPRNSNALKAANARVLCSGLRENAGDRLYVGSRTALLPEAARSGMPLASTAQDRRRAPAGSALQQGRAVQIQISAGQPLPSASTAPHGACRRQSDRSSSETEEIEEADAGWTTEQGSVSVSMGVSNSSCIRAQQALRITSLQVLAMQSLSRVSGAAQSVIATTNFT